MAKMKRLKKLRLQGFNNLTKSLSFNIYDVCYAKTAEDVRRYIAYIDDVYNAERLTEILTRATVTIGANILNIARQDYEPQGASVTILICEEPIRSGDGLANGQVHRDIGNGETALPLVGDRTSEVLVGHLDKSHICVHTYPEHHPDNGICTFRADIEISTCGRISPLAALNALIREFDADVMSLDYRVRGFTRDFKGRKFFIDHRITSIQNFIDPDILADYQAVDVNVYQESMFHTKMMWKKVDLDRYLFGGKAAKKAVKTDERHRIKRRLGREIEEIFYGRNFQ